MVQQAWSFKAIEQEDLRYWGNDGYHDDSSLFYRYDSFVANHKNVKNGDVVIITNRENVLGVSVIEKIETQNINKNVTSVFILIVMQKKFFQERRSNQNGVVIMDMNLMRQE